MPNVIKLTKGLDFELSGAAARKTTTACTSPLYALYPDDFVGVKPKLAVREGDSVLAGEALFVNKAYPEMSFVSPVSGTVTQILRGERRKLMRVVVTASETQEYKTYEIQPVHQYDAASAQTLLLQSGLWAFLKERPYDVTACPDHTPKGIFISTFSKMPLAADFTYVVADQMEDFQAGVSLLARLSPVYVGLSKAQLATPLAQVQDATVTAFDGPNPAGNVGVHINHLSPINKGEVVYTIGAEAVIFIGRLLRTGRVDLQRTLAVAGSCVQAPHYVQAVIGASLQYIVGAEISQEKAIRLICGNPLVGVQTALSEHLNAFATEITAIPEGEDVHEMLGWIMPRFNQFSANHSYFSWLLGRHKTYDLDARIKGGKRHIIMSGEYDRVFPMDIYPEFLIKAILTGNIDKMEALGIYEVAPEDFAVAEFVDSSKLELQRIVREGLDLLRQEMA